MPSVRYANQTAPFWDFVAQLEEQGHPFFQAHSSQQPGEESSDNEAQPNPWTQGWAGFPFGQLPHRGRFGGPPGRSHHAPQPSSPPGDHNMNDNSDEKHDPEEGLSDPRGAPPPFSEQPPHQPGTHRHHGGPHRSSSGRGRCRGRGGFGGRHRGAFGPMGPMGGFGELAHMFQSQLFGENNEKSTEESQDFKPEVDVFDTPEAYIVHASLPGAKKEDVAVSFQIEKSELTIAGVSYRPGDEELLKTLALDERKVGPFERKVRLGSRANPAQVDVDAITAKLEDGVLRVEVPKLDAEYVEIKKVDIE